ncbi:MAG: hypothetical protein RBR68_14610 [Tenuifilaceae bacterium]|nr:hypothetical protein [Tenuifilaceae bacterium]
MPLVTTHCSLFTLHCSLFSTSTFGYWGFALSIRASKLVTRNLFHCSQFFCPQITQIVCRLSLLTLHSSLFTAHSSLFTTYCLLPIPVIARSVLCDEAISPNASDAGGKFVFANS